MCLPIMMYIIFINVCGVVVKNILAYFLMRHGVENMQRETNSAVISEKAVGVKPLLRCYFKKSNRCHLCPVNPAVVDRS